MFEAASQAVELPHDDDVSLTLLAQTHHFVQGWTGLATAAGPVHKCATQLPAAARSIFTQFRELHLRILLVCRAYASVQHGSHSINPLAADRLSATITAPTICGKIHSVNNCFSNARGVVCQRGSSGSRPHRCCSRQLCRMVPLDLPTAGRLFRTSLRIWGGLRIGLVSVVSQMFNHMPTGNLCWNSSGVSAVSSMWSWMVVRKRSSSNTSTP